MNQSLSPSMRNRRNQAEKNQQAGAAGAVAIGAAPRWANGCGSDGSTAGSTAGDRAPSLRRSPRLPRCQTSLPWSLPWPAELPGGSKREPPVQEAQGRTVRWRKCRNQPQIQPKLSRPATMRPSSGSTRTRSSGPVARPLSTFSIDVDTASYANVRRFLNQRTSCRRRTRSGSRRCSTTSPTTIRRRHRAAAIPFAVHARGRPLPLERRAPAGPDRHRRQADRPERPRRRATSSS